MNEEASEEANQEADDPYEGLFPWKLDPSWLNGHDD